MGRKIAVGIEIESMGIKLAKIALVENRLQILELAFFPLPGNEEENFSSHSAQCLRQFLKSKGLKIRKSLAGISGRHLNIRYLRVPPVSPQRLAKIVAMDVEQFTSTASTDLSHGYLALDFPIPSAQERLTAVAVAKSGFLDRLHHFFREAGIRITAFVPNAYALYYAFIKLGKIPEKQMLYLIDIGYTNIDLALVYESTLYFLRNVNTGSNVLTEEVQESDSDEFQEAETFRIKKGEVSSESKIEQEGRRTLADGDEDSALENLSAAHNIPDAMEASLKYARLQTRIQNLQAKEIFITGSASKQKGMRELLETRLARPVSFLTLEKSSLTFASPELESNFAENSHLYPVALGLAYLGCQDTTMKMVGSRQRVHELLMGKHLFEYAALGITALFALIGIFITWNSRAYYQRHREELKGKCERLQRKAEDCRKIAAQNEEMEKKLTILDDHIASNRELLKALQCLRENMPPKMYLTELKFTREGGLSRVTVKGRVEEDCQDVSLELDEFKTSLENSLGWKCEVRHQVVEDPKKLEFTLVLSPK